MKRRQGIRQKAEEGAISDSATREVTASSLKVTISKQSGGKPDENETWKLGVLEAENRRELYITAVPAELEMMRSCRFVFVKFRLNNPDRE